MSQFSPRSQSETPLVDALNLCVHTPDAPFYTPGHKRGQGISPVLTALLGTQVFQADLPELPELDNLFAPDAAIQQAQELAAAAFGAEQTWFLVNGSTCGVIAAILATCNPGDKIILPRNVHQSAISGLVLSGAMPVFVQPEYDSTLGIAHGIPPIAVQQALVEHPDVKAILMVYPTYYGVCGDVAAIAQLARQHKIPLLVDEAHGAHFGFHPSLPTPALAAGADLSVQSIHKTLSAMTQAAMVHVQGQRVDRDRLTKALAMVQSTSPSYLLLASLDAARQQMATMGQALLEQTLKLAEAARSRLSQSPGFSLLMPDQAGTPGFVSLDRTRLTVTVANLGMDGFTADRILHQQFGVTAELPTLRHLTFIFSIGNTPADVDQLVAALRTLAAAEKSPTTQNNRPEALYPQLPTSMALAPRDAFFAPTATVPIEQSIHCVSAELVCPYPPGIPVLFPGEVITQTAIAYLRQVLTSGGMISGCTDPTLNSLKVVRCTELAAMPTMQL
jgi:arginine/lysine/ornithine decarboxylase